MPFSGFFNKYGHAYAGSHPCYDDGASAANSCKDSLGFADWSTDLFAAPGTPVRPRVYAPINGASFAMKIRSVSTSCAGKNVRVGIYRNGGHVGDVSYAHLANVPAFTIGQTVLTSTTLGYLRRWPPCSSYQVTSDAGTHTHIEVGTVNGVACYLPYGKGTAVLPDMRLIGKILPGSTATCP